MSRKSLSLAGLSPVDVLTRCFGGLFGTETWRPWRCFVAALSGRCEGLTAEDRALVLRCTGRTVLPTVAATEAAAIVGRRGGKSRIAAALAVILACFRTYPQLALGERGVLMVIAPDKKQARVIFNYVKGLLKAEPMLAALIENETKEAIDLSNGISIEVVTSSFRTVRGFTAVGVLLDEVAFLPSDDSAEPDTELLNALRPAMATIPDALLLMISSPYARRGELWRAYDQHFGKDDAKVFVWQAATRVMHPDLPQSVIDREMERDPASAMAEYGAEFRTDIERFISRERVEMVTGSYVEHPPIADVEYTAFLDPSGGSADSMTLAIGHTEAGKVVIDAMREQRPPFSPEGVIGEFAALLRSYRVDTVEGDRYGGEWPREVIRKAGLAYRLCDKPKSELYLALLPLINGGLIELPRSERLQLQLVGLERRTARGGRDTVDHGPQGHDDVANAVAGVAHRLSVKTRIPLEIFGFDHVNTPTEAEQEKLQQDRLEEAARVVQEQILLHGVYFPGVH